MDSLKLGYMLVREYIQKFESLIKYFKFYQVRPRKDWK